MPGNISLLIKLIGNRSVSRYKKIKRANLKFILQLKDTASCRPKRRGAIQLVFSAVFKSQYPLVTQGRANLHICEGNINAEQKAQVVGATCCHPDVFLKEGVDCFSSTNHSLPNHSLGMLLRYKRVQVINCPVCSPDLPPLKTLGTI